MARRPIRPRRSRCAHALVSCALGLFDLMDIFCTAASLANTTALPHDRYLDCVDQSSLLLADEGVSARRAVFFWLQGTFSGLRIAEYKARRVKPQPI